MATSELAATSRARLAEGQLEKCRVAANRQVTELREVRLQLRQTQNELAHAKRFIPVERVEEMRRTSPHWSRLPAA